MATITELLNPISSRNMMANSVYYQCRRPASLSSPWHFGKRPKKRHSSSLSLFDSSVFSEDITETNSLPCSPLAFVSFDERKRTSSEETGNCESDITNLLSTSGSSGYGSAFSESSSPYSCSTSPSFSYFLFSNKSSSAKERQSTIPVDLPIEATNVSQSKETVTKNNNNELNSTGTSLQFSEHSKIVTSTLHTDSSRTSASDRSNSPSETSTSSSSSRLTLVPVKGKRKNSESSSSGGSTTSDDAIRHRVKDDEGFIRRAACLCVNEDETKVVLISSKNEGGGWLVPGGGLESGEGEAEAAEREAWEEAGITGNVKRCLGVFQSEDEVTHKKKRTAVYVLTVQQEHSVFPEASLGRVREWFSIDTAVQYLSQCKPHQTAYLRAL